LSARGKPALSLRDPVALKRSNDNRWQCERAVRLARFHVNENALGSARLEGLADAESSAGEVHVWPLETEYLAQTQSQSHAARHDRFESMTYKCVE
jgi:hypothetical protein